MVKMFLNGGNPFTKSLNWIFGKIQFFDNRWCEFHFCRLEIDYTTFASVFFCLHIIILVRKTEKSIFKVILNLSGKWLKNTYKESCILESFSAPMNKIFEIYLWWNSFFFFFQFNILLVIFMILRNDSLLKCLVWHQFH